MFFDASSCFASVAGREECSELLPRLSSRATTLMALLRMEIKRATRFRYLRCFRKIFLDATAGMGDEFHGIIFIFYSSRMVDDTG